jgi:hypothetical protein
MCFLLVSVQETAQMAETEQITWEEFLQDAARYGDTEDVQAALANKANVDAADELGRTGEDRLQIGHDCKETAADLRAGSTCLSYAALHMAAGNGHLEIVLHLLSAGAVGAISLSACDHQQGLAASN